MIRIIRSAATFVLGVVSQDTQHARAVGALGTAVGATSVAWTDRVEFAVRVIAGLVAIISGIYATAYYRTARKRLKAGE